MYAGTNEPGHRRGRKHELQTTSVNCFDIIIVNNNSREEEIALVHPASTLENIIFCIGIMAGISIQPASEADLDDLVRIQFAAIGAFGHETLVSGEASPANMSIMAERHAQHMRANPGLIVAKAQVSDGRVAGFGMFYFPDPDAASNDREKVVTPLRSASDDPDWARITIQAPWIEDEDRRRRAETFLRFIHNEKQKHVKHNECIYIRYMCVDPTFQRRGVGKSLMSWACNRLDALKLDAYLEASPAGEALYRQFGFEVVGRTKDVLGDGLKMEYAHMWRNHSS
ncbi:hypothetical protein PFICI_05592 [Pestalotiopsis fici W106-1]|uniref:N-acetyltransferase domain-containing protein n=1 Tax=Pestalotiopsis fici (strain W106-1 / CGMCC3.15140) TaxID=1229662 RepID=W3XEW0_PESFW|nr:uncharacterized protein PFICI_05592 [Pestalotiopsis fici W106-1]ETS83716.1 hypothetical protein PFICI_05592 [Pestalotiopsis fici W106-1]